MGVPDPEMVASLLSNPGARAQISEMLSNPQMIDMILQSHPTLRSMPHAREMMMSPMFREMMTNPDLIRQMGAFNPPPPPGGAFPAPGANEATGAGTTDSSSPQPPQQQPPNPLAGMLGGGAGGQPGQMPAIPPALLQSILGGGLGGGSPNPTPGAGTQSPPPPGANPFASFLEQMQQAQASGAPPSAEYLQRLGELASQGAQANPFAGLFGPLGGVGAPQVPVDNRPPEERYAVQLEQLNEMGFHDFDSNVNALRRSGGNVQGALNFLLGG